MPGNRKLVETALTLVALLASLSFVRPAHAQGLHPAYSGTFTLPYQVRWGASVLQPGEYTVTIKSTGSPMIARVRTADGNAVTNVMNGSVSTHTNGENALLIREKGGRLVVYSLTLADLGFVLIYEPALAQEPVKEARLDRSVRVLSAKK